MNECGRGSWSYLGFQQQTFGKLPAGHTPCSLVDRRITANHWLQSSRSTICLLGYLRCSSKLDSSFST